MKAFKILFLVVVVALFAVSPTLAASSCVTIKDGIITDSKGNVLTMGYDQWGYNYQAHMFNGLSSNYTRPAVPFTEGSETLVMKWSDNWLANVDCNFDGKLDRGLDAKTGLSTGTSMGWVTNHYEGDYEDAGESYHYTYFAKIVYVGPVIPGVEDSWAATRIWGVYAVIEEVNNDPHGGFHGVDKNSLAHPAGLGIDYGP